MSLAKRILSLSLLFALLTPAVLQGQDRKLFEYDRRLWVLEFKHKQPQRFEFSFDNYQVKKGMIGPRIKKRISPSPLDKKEVYWYVRYKLTTGEKKPLSVFIDVVAESTSEDAKRVPTDGLYPRRPKRVIKYHDGYYPVVQQALERKFKRRFWGQNDLTISAKSAPRDRNSPTKLNLPVLGGVNAKKPAIINFKDGNELRGKITLANENRIQLSEFQNAWNMIPFIRNIIKNKEKFSRAIITKTSAAGGGEIEGKIVDFARDEVIYKKFDEEGNVSLDLIKSIKVEIPRSKMDSISYECIAIFKKWDRNMDYLKITFKGLIKGILYDVGRQSPPHWSRAGVLLNQSKALREAEELERIALRAKERGDTEEAKNLRKLANIYRKVGPHDRVLRQTVLELRFKRPGDEFYTVLDRMQFISKRWKTYAKIIKMDLPGKQEGY